MRTSRQARLLLAAKSLVVRMWHCFDPSKGDDTEGGVLERFIHEPFYPHGLQSGQHLDHPLVAPTAASSNLPLSPPARAAQPTPSQWLLPPFFFFAAFCFGCGVTSIQWSTERTRA